MALFQSSPVFFETFWFPMLGLLSSLLLFTQFVWAVLDDTGGVEIIGVFVFWSIFDHYQIPSLLGNIIFQLSIWGHPKDDPKYIHVCYIHSYE